MIDYELGVRIEQIIHFAHTLFRGYIIGLSMGYNEALGKTSDFLAQKIGEFHELIRKDGRMTIGSCEKLAWDAIIHLIGRVNIDMYLLLMRSELTTFQDVIDANREM